MNRCATSLYFMIGVYIVVIKVEATVNLSSQFQYSTNEVSTDFWTPEQMQMAINNSEDLIVNNGNKIRIRRDTEFWTKSKMREAKDDMPNPSGEYFRRMGISVATDVQLMSSNFDSQPATMLPADISKAPWKHFGRLFFYKTVDGRPGTCTAAFVHPRIILTAAHCVKNPSGWYRNMTFYHRYNTTEDRGKPIRIDKIFSARAYDDDEISASYGYGNLSFDYAFATTKEASRGGFLGVRFGQLSDTILSGGYPENRLSGERLIYTRGSKGLVEGSFVNVPSNQMRQGSSGGAWLVKLLGKFYVIGLNSHTRNGTVGMFSPKFDHLTTDLFHNVVDLVNSQSG